MDITQSCDNQTLHLPEQLLKHPLFLMVSVLKLAKQQGFQYRQQSNTTGQDDLNLVHIAVLSCLENIGPLSQKEVSQLLNADPSDLVSIMDKLESAGYVRRSRDEKDRRRHSVELTQKGKTILPKIHSRSLQFTEKFLMPLNNDERQQLQELLFKIIVHHAETQHSA